MSSFMLPKNNQKFVGHSHFWVEKKRIQWAIDTLVWEANNPNYDEVFVEYYSANMYEFHSIFRWWSMPNFYWIFLSPNDDQIEHHVPRIKSTVTRKGNHNVRISYMLWTANIIVFNFQLVLISNTNNSNEVVEVFMWEHLAHRKSNKI